MDAVRIWLEILEDVRRYPSSHNSQPIRVELLSDDQARLYYDLDRGLASEDSSATFGHVVMGTFLHSLTVCAAVRGYRVHEELLLPELDLSATERLQAFGTVRLDQQEITDEHREEFDAYLRRRTSRLPYQALFVSGPMIEEAIMIAEQAGHRFRVAYDESTVDALLRVQQQALFDDLQNNETYYRETMRWMRLNTREAAQRGDGLSAKTFLPPSWVLRFALKHRKLWRKPVIGAIFRGIYMASMRGVRQLAWLEGPFSDSRDFLEAGRLFMRIWLVFSRHNVMVHPLGTVVTNPRSRAVFTSIVTVKESAGEMAWMLFRFGYSKQPPQSYRRPLADMLVSPDASGGRGVSAPA